MVATIAQLRPPELGASVKARPGGGGTYFVLIVGVFFVIFAIALATRIPGAPDSPGRGFAKVWCIAAVFAGLLLITIALFVGSDTEQGLLTGRTQPARPARAPQPQTLSRNVAGVAARSQDVLEGS